jgi:hypothetical protein
MPFGFCLTRPVSRHSTRKLPLGPHEMASIPIRITLQVVLMLRLGFPKATGLSEFRNNLPRPKPGGFDVRNRVACDPFLIRADAEDRRTVAGSPIVALAVQSRRVMDLEKEFQELPIAELLRVENDLDRFRMRSVVAVRCIRNVAACIADVRRDHARVPAQQILHTPEAAAGKKGSFGRHVISSLLLLMFGTVLGSCRILRFRAGRQE